VKTSQQLPLPAPASPQLTDLYRKSGLSLAPFLVLVQQARSVPRSATCYPPRLGWSTSPAPWLAVLEQLIAYSRDR
jgi:hypothetical protein